jgi:hypothetical protein
MTDRDWLLDALRPVAFAIACRMLGSVSEAENVVQAYTWFSSGTPRASKQKMQTRHRTG